MAQRVPVEAVRPNRIPPHNIDAEQSVLGAMLESRDAIANVVEILKAHDFYKPAHSEIYETIMELHARSEPVDAITVADELGRRGSLQQIGGKPYILGLIEAYPTASSASHYARIVEEHSLLRQLIDAGNQVQELGFAMPENVSDAIDESEEIIYEVGNARLGRNDYHALRDLLIKNWEDIERLYERGESITGVSSGFADLDEMTSGFQPSNLIIVAARPSMGKSSILGDFALNAAVRNNTPVVIFSLEMSKDEIVKRFLASEARVDSRRIGKGSLQEQDWARLSAASGRLAEAPIFIDDSANITMMEIRAKCRRLKARQGLGLIIVDYLQLMTSPRKSENRQQEVSEISRNLKILAKEMEVPVICASQLNRAVEARGDKRPLLGDLRESGCLTEETLVSLTDGRQLPIAQLAGTNPEVVTLDGWGLTSRKAAKVWKTGRREIFEMTLASGRTIRATDNHPFLVLDGWKALGDLEPGDRIGTARRLPDGPLPEPWDESRIILLAHLIGDGCYAPRQPLHYTSASEANLVAVETSALQAFGIKAKRVPQGNWEHLYLSAGANKWHPNPLKLWLEELGIHGQRSKYKVVPEEIFGLSSAQVALFLRHLWATDGSITMPHSERKAPKGRIYYASSSRTLALQVQALLLRFEVRSRIKSVRKGSYDPSYHVIISGREDQLRFASAIGCHGERGEVLERLAASLRETRANTNVDTIPIEIWTRVKELMKERGISHRLMAKLRGSTYGGTSHFRFSPSRVLLGHYAEILSDTGLKEIANSDVYWDRVVSIRSVGVEDVFDMTVPGTHNFIANGIVVHNSIEQDSDMVMFIYRDEVYNPESQARGEAELIVGKHRNGPTGKVTLAFMNQYTKFASLAKGPVG